MCQCSKNPTWVIVGSNKTSTVQAQCQGKEVVFSKHIKSPEWLELGVRKLCGLKRDREAGKGSIGQDL